MRVLQSIDIACHVSECECRIRWLVYVMGERRKLFSYTHNGRDSGVETLGTNRHLRCMEWIFHDCICVCLVHLLEHCIRRILGERREEYELCPYSHER